MVIVALEIPIREQKNKKNSCFEKSTWKLQGQSDTVIIIMVDQFLKKSSSNTLEKCNVWQKKQTANRDPNYMLPRVPNNTLSISLPEAYIMDTFIKQQFKVSS